MFVVIIQFQAVDSGYWQALKIGGTVPPARTSQAAMVDTRGRMWIVGGETFTHSRHIDMVATFSPDFSNPDVQVKEVREFRCREVREVWEIYTSWTTWTSQLFL